MASNLLRKLAVLEKPAQSALKSGASGVRLYEKPYPLDERLFGLSHDSLLLMGLTGGRFDISRVVFLDTETTGLSGGAGTVAFLVGIGYLDNNRFTVKQFLMPDYSAEPEMLLLLKNELKRFDTVVHFNGRRFDMPLLSNRCVMKRIDDFTSGLEQLDLLYPAKSVWKLRLGSCRLSRLESEVLGMPERDDIPGSEIPQRYFESIKQQDLSLLQDVIEHNRQDIATLATLLCKLESLYSAPEKMEEQTDIFSLGRAFERKGELHTARALYLKASLPRPVRTATDLRNDKYAGEANFHLYLLERRLRDWDKCEQTLLNMIKRRQMGLLPHLELCKLYEHRMKRYEDALSQCEILLLKCSSSKTDDIKKRYNRIQSKLRRVQNV